MLVQIDTVDIANRLAHVITQRDGKIKVGFRATAGFFQIPKQGERWIIERNTSWEWHFLHRQDRPDEHDSKLELEEGDGHLRVATGQALLVEASQVVLRDPENKDGVDAHVAIPGDFLLELASLHLRLVGSALAPQPLAPTACETHTYGAGSHASFTLQDTPVSTASVQVFWKGELLTPGSDWTRAGKVLTLVGVTGAGDLVVYYQTLR